jgi:hypothetical protein
MTTRNLLLIASMCLLAACSADTPDADASADADDWQVLFDGESLDGWRSFKSEQPPAGWIVENGALHLAEPGGGDIMTAQSYGDFELEFEWRISKNGNSGVIYRINVLESTTHTYETGPEYQVLDNDGHADRADPTHRAAALYDLVAPPGDFTRPVGEYNQGRIVVQGDRIEHWLNGEKVAESPFGNDAWRDMVDESKFGDWPEFGKYDSGHIAFQDHSDLVWYRSVRIREL